jgi:Clr5 domain
MASITSDLGALARSTEGPTAQQWNNLRDEISALYAMRPLKEVRAIMERRHGFRAT